jgi:hypothetical protein
MRSSLRLVRVATGHPSQPDENCTTLATAELLVMRSASVLTERCVPFGNLRHTMYVW